MKTCHTALCNLENVLSHMINGIARSPDQWLFEVENAKTTLIEDYQAQSKQCGYSGSLKDDVPGLEHLRTAILRLSVLTIFGGFGVTFNVVISTVREAVNDLKLYLQSEPCQGESP